MQTPTWTRALALAGCLVALALAGCDGSREQSVVGTAGDLLAALERGDGETAERLLEAGVVPEGTNAEGKTAVMLALELGEPSLAEALVEGGAEVDAVDAGGASLLFDAVRSGELALVKALLDHGANPHGKIPEGGALVAYAVEQGRTAAAQLLFRSGATRKAYGSNGAPVTFAAARRGCDWLLEDLLEQGAHVEARDKRGDTLMHLAVRLGRSELLPVLWRSGADINVVNKEGQTPLHVALGLGRPELVTGLLKYGASPGLPDRDGKAPLVLAMERGDEETLQALLIHGAQADVTAPDGRSLVAMALDQRKFKTSQVLVDRGVGVEGYLRAAVAAGDDALFDFLISNGVDPNVSRDEPPLTEAIRRDDERMACALLEAGADPKAVGREGQSVFHMALARDLTGTVKELLERGADPNAEFKYPVREEFVKLVKSEGIIKWYLRKDRRITPLMLAADRGSLDMAKLLLGHEAKTGVWTRTHRQWPINFASRRNDVPLMQLMLKRDPTKKGRSVKVDLSEQKAWVYEKDGKVLLETKISSGKKGYRTRTGEFVITNKHRYHTSTIYRGASMPYFQRLSCSDFGFHRGYCPGYAASHGCIRVPGGNASKLYSLTSVGDRVTVVD